MGIILVNAIVITVYSSELLLTCWSLSNVTEEANTPLHCANGGGTEYEQQCSGLWQVMKSQVNGSMVPSPPRPAGAWEVKSQGNSISEQAVYAEGFMSFKFCVAGDWCSLFLEFGAGFLILPTRTPSLPNNTIASCLLYKCFQESTGQNVKVWWFLKVVPTWTLLKDERNPHKEPSPPLGCTPLGLSACPLILYPSWRSVSKCHCLPSGLRTGISFHLHYLLTPQP